MSNWAGVGEFEDLVEDTGGEADFPLLSHLLPHANGGMYPVELAEPTLIELDRFIQKVSDVDEWVLCDYKTGKEVWRPPRMGLSHGCTASTNALA